MCKHNTCTKHVDETKPCTFTCIPGCECEKGYVRNENGKCVLAPTVFDCGKNRWFVVLKLIKLSDTIKISNALNKVALKRFKISERENEIFDPCPSPCHDDECRRSKSIRKCDTKINQCVPKCVCRSGFLRQSGNCIPANKCGEFSNTKLQLKYKVQQTPNCQVDFLNFSISK